MGHGECAGVLSSLMSRFMIPNVHDNLTGGNRTTRAGSCLLPFHNPELARIGLSESKHGSCDPIPARKDPMAAYSAREHFLRREGS